MASKDGTKSRDRSHENRDTAFHGLPEEFPDQVITGYAVDSADANECNYGHHKREAEKEAQGNLLFCFDFGSSKDDDGNADNFNDFSKIIQISKGQRKDTENIGKHVQADDESGHGNAKQILWRLITFH